jgi:predicted nucleic acid-binding protein
MILSNFRGFNASAGISPQRTEWTPISVPKSTEELRAPVVLDEKAARREAQSLAVKFTGPLGLLQLAVERKWMTPPECIARVRQLCDRGFRIPRPAPDQTFADYLRSFQ